MAQTLRLVLDSVRAIIRHRRCYNQHILYKCHEHCTAVHYMRVQYSDIYLIVLVHCVVFVCEQRNM